MATIISLVNQKGGVGKSSTAVALCYWLAKIQKCQVCLVDTDGQKTSSIWMREMDIPIYYFQDPQDLYEEVVKIEAEYVVIDGPANDPEMTLAILERSDLGIIPIQPTGPDLNASVLVARQIKRVRDKRQGLRAGFLLSRILRGTLLLRETQEVLSTQFPGIETFDQAICQRQAIANSAGQGLTVWDLSDPASKEAAQEYVRLFEEVATWLSRNH